MAKISRNDPCSCGSGKKFKRCCLPRLEAKRELSAKQARLNSEKKPTAKTKDILRYIQQNRDELVELTDRSNDIIDLIHKRELDKAETDAKKLAEDFPDDHDGLELLAWVKQEKSEKEEALHFYQKAIALAQKNSTSQNNEHLKWLQQRADNLKNSIET